VSLVVALDGPAGVGKSTAARRVAERLGVPYLDTGAMYRCLALRVLRAGVELDDRAAVENEARAATLELELQRGGPRLILDGAPVGSEIRTPEVTSATSKISRYAGVRARMVELQRAFGRSHGGVIEGRDIGSVVFPETPHKFYLDADPEVRAERRYRELAQHDPAVVREDVVRDLLARDRQDREREEAPLIRTASHQPLDTTALAIEEVVDRIVAAVREPAHR
jgi:cytidylate kinase